MVAFVYFTTFRLSYKLRYKNIQPKSILMSDFTKPNGLHKAAIVCILFLLSATGFSQTKYEAENAQLTGTSVATSNPGYTGTGYVTGLNTTTDKITFTVNVSASGSYPLVFRYQNSCGVCEKAQFIRINSGAEVYTQFLPAATGWSNLNYGNVSLNAGNNTIEIRSSWGWTDFDYITVGSPSLSVSPSSLTFTSAGGSNNVGITSNVSWSASDNQSWISVTPSGGSNNGSVSVSVSANAGAQRSGSVTISGGGLTRTVSVTQAAGAIQTKYEAENATLNGTTVSASNPGYSGTGYVTGLDASNDKIIFTVNAATAGSYPLVFRYQNSCGVCEKAQFVRINNGAEVYTQFLPAATGWSDKNYGSISLNAGNNTIEIRSSWGWTDFDYITVGTGGGGSNLNVNPTALNFSSGTGTNQINVTSNVTWSASDNQSWISLSPSGGSGNGTINVSVTANGSTSSRTGSVTISGGGITRSVSVNQNGVSDPDEATIGTNFWRIDWGNGWGDYFVSGINWSTVTNPWRSDFISDLDPYSVLRFMDWGPTNGSEFVNWSSRISKTSNNYNAQVPLTNGDGSGSSGAGVAYEWQIDLCNRATADMWINIPHKASDDFVRQLARLIRDNLDNDQKVYVEYSNEIWNWGFQQTHYADAQGTALGFVGGYPFKGKTVYINAWWGFYVYRSCQVARIFEQEFAGQTQRLVKVLGTQLGYNNWPDLVAEWGDVHPPTLQKMAALAQSSINPNNVTFDLFTVAPYWNGNDLASMQANIDVIEDRMDEVQLTLTDHGNGIRLGCYEAGQDGGNQVANAQNPGIYNVYIDALNRVGGRLAAPLVHYTHVGWDSNHAWGAKQSTGASLSSSHKYRAIVDWVDDNVSSSARIRTPHSKYNDTPDVQAQKDNTPDKNVSVYPNPSRANTLMVEIYTDNESVAEIEIMSFDTQTPVLKVKHILTPGVNQIRIPIDGARSGLHILDIHFGTRRAIRKIAIEK